MTRTNVVRLLPVSIVLTLMLPTAIAVAVRLGPIEILGKHFSPMQILAIGVISTAFGAWATLLLIKELKHPEQTLPQVEPDSEPEPDSTYDTRR